MIKTKAYLEQLQPVIDASWFNVDNGTYIYLKVNEVTQPEKHLMVTRDTDEITILTEISNLHLVNYTERNKDDWKLINIRCGNPFYCVGFIAHITDLLSAVGIDIVLISTFSKDLVLMMEKDLEETVTILIGAGFKREHK